MVIRVLLAEDHELVRDGLHLLIERAGDMTVVGEASNGREAVLLAQKLRPDVSVLDIGMPEMNGIEAARQILDLVPESQVLILSMHATMEYVYRALSIGALGYVIKASGSAELVEAVRTVYAGKRFLSPRISEGMIDEYVRQRHNSPGEDPLTLLSPREREVLQLVVEGGSSKQIADRILIAPSTVDTYRSRMMRKLGLDSLAALVVFAIEHGVTPQKG
jgi:two-component system, NarL family, response regulator NreC